MNLEKYENMELPILTNETILNRKQQERIFKLLNIDYSDYYLNKYTGDIKHIDDLIINEKFFDYRGLTKLELREIKINNILKKIKTMNDKRE